MLIRHLLACASAIHNCRAMRRIGLLVTAFALAGSAILCGNALGPQSRQTQKERFKAGGLRTFDIVPLETVSETSSNASIGDLNGDGHLDIVLV